MSGATSLRRRISIRQLLVREHRRDHPAPLPEPEGSLVRSLLSHIRPIFPGCYGYPVRAGLDPHAASCRIVGAVDDHLSVGRLAALAGITVRTLHHYDEIGPRAAVGADPVRVPGLRAGRRGAAAAGAHVSAA